MTRLIFDDLAKIKRLVQAGTHLIVGLDYDGTLTPIVDDPSQAILCPSTRAVVQRIAARPDTTVAVVSGRRLDDVRDRVGVDGLIYAGNHGLEICGLGLNFIEPSALKMRRAIGWLAVTLAHGLADVPGVVVENKSLTISVHCRKVAPPQMDQVYRHVQAVTAVAPGCLCICPGDKILDVRPQVDWHKGTAMHWIADRLDKQALTIYLGDDRTDEDAFLTHGDAITVKVGASSETSAHYHVNDPGGVCEFLFWLANVDMTEGKP